MTKPRQDLRTLAHPLAAAAFSPIAKGRQIVLACSRATLNAAIDGGLNSKLGEWIGLVHGNPSGGAEVLQPIQARRLFRGLSRPGFTDVFAYIVPTRITFIWPRTFQSQGIRPVTAPAPTSVFAVYVRIAERPDNDVRVLQLRDETGIPSIAGEVLDWEFVMADEQVRDLPHGYQTRYGGEVWSR